MRLEDLSPGLSLAGIEPSAVVTTVAVVPIADGAVQVIYKTPDGILKDRLLGRIDEPTFSIATQERPWAFDGDGETFKLAVEAKRIDLAFLFDPMMAVHTSSVDPLPHQITAVYEAMLPRQPLRFVLADDPGAGKTIMAGLYIRELLMRADARRILIVAPGSLVEHWRDELFEKFGLEFRVFSKELEATSPSGNPFEDHDHLIVRLDPGVIHAQVHDFREPFPWGECDRILNIRSFQALHPESLRKAARTFYGALRQGGHAFFDTQNVQGDARDWLEDALLDAGCTLLGIESARWYRHTIREIGIPTNFLLGRPFLIRGGARYRGRKADARAKEDEEVLDGITAEYRRRVEASAEEQQGLWIDTTIRIAHVVYNTG